MADVKISALTAAASVSETDLVVIVQGNQTKRTSISKLVASVVSQVGSVNTLAVEAATSGELQAVSDLVGG